MSKGDRDPNRARPERDSDSHILDTLKKLQRKDYERFLDSLALHVSEIPAHPEVESGWWCSHFSLMQELLPYLADDPPLKGLKTRDNFRLHVGKQLSVCRKCRKAYHEAVSNFELSSNSKVKVVLKRIRALIDWDIDRLLPKLCEWVTAAADPLKVDSANQVREGGEAFLETLLSFRICSNSRISRVIGTAFVKASPLSSNADILLLAEDHGYIPSGLIALCFHQKVVVNAWAHRIYGRLRQKYKPQSPVIQFVLKKVVRQLESYASGEYSEKDVLPFASDRKTTWEGFEMLLNSMDRNSLIAFSTTFGSAKLFRTVVLGVRDAEETVVAPASSCLVSMLRNIDVRTLFVSDSLSPERLLNGVFISFGSCCSQSTRRKLLDLIAPIIATARAVLDKRGVSRLFQAAFDFFNNSICSGSGRATREGLFEGMEDPLDLSSERKDIIRSGASLLNWYYTHSAPFLPVNDAAAISRFVLLVLRGDNESEHSWTLLRTVLVTDVFNLIQLLKNTSDTRHIAHTFFSKRSRHFSHWHGEEDIMSNFIRPQESDEREHRWLKPLWLGVRSGFHINSSAGGKKAISGHEVRIWLDLHRVIGMVDPSRVSEEMADTKSEAARGFGTLEGSFKSEGDGKFLCERLGTIQAAINERFFVACEGSANQDWWKDLPFHATHLLASSHREVAHKAFVTLKKSRHLFEASCAGSQSKLVASILKTDSEGAEMMADGCLSAMRIISALGYLNAMRTYLSFLLWFRVLLDSKYVGLLESENSDWALGVVETFLGSWRSFERSTAREEFIEVCCRLFSNLRDLWDRFLLLGPIIHGDDINIDRRQAALHRVLRRLIEMNTMKYGTALAAWKTTVCFLAKSWKDVSYLRNSVVTLIEYHESNKDALSYADCQQIADSADLKEVDLVLKRWAQSVYQMRAPITKMKQTTTIDQYFKPLVEGNTMIRAVVEKKNSTPFIGKRFASMNALEIRSLKPPSNIRPLHKLPGQSSALDDLRRDVRASRKDPRRSGQLSRLHMRANAGSRDRGKTKFEILVEKQIAAKAAAKAAEKNACLRGEGEVYDLDATKSEPKSRFVFPPCIDIGKKAQSRLMNIDVDADRTNVTKRSYVVPLDKRICEPRFSAKLYRSILTFRQETLESFSDRSIAYKSVESYIKHWEPVIREEFRSSLQNMITNERTAWVRECPRKEFLGWRSEFEVDGTVENVGYAQLLSIRCTGEKAERSDGKCKVSEFNVSKVQSLDIVLLHILPPRYMDQDKTEKRIPPALALVKKVTRKASEFSLLLHIAFEDLSRAPGKGRRILVSRLTSANTFQRQLDSLWTLHKICDGALWPVLEPKKGMSINEDVYNEQLNLFKQCINSRELFISKMRRQGCLNDSQADAIVRVVRCCAPLFRLKQAHYGLSEHVDDHGSMTLIQGPPGTGKTSTILGLLSALLNFEVGDVCLKRVRINFESGNVMMQVPKVRILVCAPSNAAVDELMVRVMEKGLRTSFGSAVCPRMVRVGGGTTNDAIKMLEIWNIAERSMNKGSSSDFDLAWSKRRQFLQKELIQLNIKIGIADKERKSCDVYDDDERHNVNKESTQKKKSYAELTDHLSSLHRRKKEVIQELNQARSALQDGEASRKQENLQHVARILNGCSLVFATLSSSGHELLQNVGARFDVIIVDEAAQSCEPEVLIPIACSSSARNPKLPASHIVLVGDPKQLPATVISTNKDVQGALGRSLFERISESSPRSVHMLRTQYRMHPAISLFPNSHFYGGLLSDGENVTSRQSHRSFHTDRQLRFGPLTFLDTSRTNTQEIRTSNGSLYNSAEANMVVTAIIALVRKYPEKHNGSIVVLSPYKQQVSILKGLVRESRILAGLDIEVSTVDGIQGREKSIVFLSTVRSGVAHGIGFVDDDRRMNVAITRAKHSLIVVGNAATLSQGSALWDSLISHCRSRSLLKCLPQNILQFFPETNRRFTAKCAHELPEREIFPALDKCGRALTSESKDNGIGNVPKNFGCKVHLRSQPTTTTSNVNIPGILSKKGEDVRVDECSNVVLGTMEKVSVSTLNSQAVSAHSKRSIPEFPNSPCVEEKRLYNANGDLGTDLLRQRPNVPSPSLRCKIPGSLKQKTNIRMLHQNVVNLNEKEKCTEPFHATGSSRCLTVVEDTSRKGGICMPLTTGMQGVDAGIFSCTNQPENARSTDPPSTTEPQKSVLELDGDTCKRRRGPDESFVIENGRSIAFRGKGEERSNELQCLESMEQTREHQTNVASVTKASASSPASQAAVPAKTNFNAKGNCNQVLATSDLHHRGKMQRRFPQPFQKCPPKSRKLSQISEDRPNLSSAAVDGFRNNAGGAHTAQAYESSCRETLAVNRTSTISDQPSISKTEHVNKGSKANILNRLDMSQKYPVTSGIMPMMSAEHMRHLSNGIGRPTGKGRGSGRPYRSRPSQVTPTGHSHSTRGAGRASTEASARLMASFRGKKRGPPSERHREHAKKPKVAPQASNCNSLKQGGKNQISFSLAQSQKQMRQTQDMIKRVT